jgi:hypothetical protein
MIYQKTGIVNFPQELTGECELEEFKWQWTDIAFNRASNTWSVTVEMWEIHAKRTIVLPITLERFSEANVDAAILKLEYFENSKPND